MYKEDDDGHLPTYKLQRKKKPNSQWEPIEVLSPVRSPVRVPILIRSTSPIPSAGNAQLPAGSPTGNPPRGNLASPQASNRGPRAGPATPPTRGSPSGDQVDIVSALVGSPEPAGAEAASSPAREQPQQPTNRVWCGNLGNWLQAGFAGSRNRLQQQFLFVILRIRERSPGLLPEDAFNEFVRDLIAVGAFQDRLQIGGAWRFAFQGILPLQEHFTQIFQLSAENIQRLMVTAWQGFR